MGIQGQMLRISARRDVAIYLLDGTLWVADFVDGNGELFEPQTWFRFNCGTPGAEDAQRRMLRESGLPLSVEMVEKINGLHRGLAASGTERSTETPSSSQPKPGLGVEPIFKGTCDAPPR